LKSDVEAIFKKVEATANAGANSGARAGMMDKTALKKALAKYKNGIKALREKEPVQD
jgi:recombinational DNA repair protein RecT